jgi:hypothetical protein
MSLVPNIPKLGLMDPRIIVLVLEEVGGLLLEWYWNCANSYARNVLLHAHVIRKNVIYFHGLIYLIKVFMTFILLFLCCSKKRIFLTPCVIPTFYCGMYGSNSPIELLVFFFKFHTNPNCSSFSSSSKCTLVLAYI